MVNNYEYTPNRHGLELSFFLLPFHGITILKIYWASKEVLVKISIVYKKMGKWYINSIKLKKSTFSLLANASRMVHMKRRRTLDFSIQEKSKKAP